MGKSNLEEEQIEHPSFAVVNISRISIGGGAVRLFDSPFKHHHAIALEINPAMLLRKLHGDTIMANGTVSHIRILMSEIQFANLMLNTNLHSGTPCTVDQIAGKRLPEPPERNLKKLWAKEVKRNFKDVAEQVETVEKAAEALLEKDRVTKGEVKALKDKITALAQDIRENLPWMQERFEEAMEGTVAAARGEIEAHLVQTIKTAGLEALQGGSAALGLELSDDSKEKP